MRHHLIFTTLLILCASIGCDGSATAEPNADTRDQNSNVVDGTGSEVAETKPIGQTENQQHDNPIAADDGKQANQVRTNQNHQGSDSDQNSKLVVKNPGQISMLSWNVESDGSSGETIATQLSELNAGDRYDIVALTEVLPENFKSFRIALGIHYKYVYSKSGRNDRMQILYNENRFKKIRSFELDDINYQGRYRAPIVVHLQERQTDLRPDKIEFMVMVNHLARGKSEVRQKQATELVKWAREQTLPIFALGDYNFDYEFGPEKGNPSFNNFLRDNVWRWVKPNEMVDTNWYDNPENPDGVDDYPESMLDFAFVAGSAKAWDSKCKIIVRKNDFPDDKKTSDHRPFELVTESPSK